MKHIIFAVAILLVGAFAGPASVSANVEFELEGFAWASTIGWISMNCSNPIPGFPDGTCASDGGIDYGVVIEDDDTVTGHAWSPNIGWIQFGGLSGFPAGNATTPADVAVVGAASMTSDFVLSGWVRACAATVGGDCSSMTTDTNTGGWDGWISMGGSYGAGSYEVMFENGEANATSFAWGGPNTMGWIDFSPDVAGGSPVRLANVPDIIIDSVDITLGTILPAGLYDFVTLEPVINGLPDGETVDWDLYLDGTLVQDGTVTQNGASTDFSPTPIQLVNLPAGTPHSVRFEVDMPVADSQVTESDEVNVFNFTVDAPFPPPVITITGPDVVRVGDTAEITATVDAPYDVSCTFRGPGINENVVVDGATGSGTVIEQSDPLQNSARFEVSCSVGSDTYTETYQVEVVPTFQEI